MAELAGRLAELEELKLHFRPGYLEGQARLHGAGAHARSPSRSPSTATASGSRVYLYDVRLYGFSPTPAAQVPVLLAARA